MITIPRILILVLLGLPLSSVSVRALALEGIVKDSEGRAIPGAEIRIQGKEASDIKVAKTDARGHYMSSGWGEGTFNVSLIVNGAVKASIANVNLSSASPTQQLNFDFKPGKVLPQAQGKHYVWMPSPTGTHLSGSWVEVDERPATSLGMRERRSQTGSNYMKKIQENSGRRSQ